MPDRAATSYKNELLRRLGVADLALLEPHLEPVRLPLRLSLERPRTQIDHVYFIDEGIASVVASLSKGRDTEIGLIGFEGMTGAVVVLGDQQSAHECYMQVAGHGLRIPAATFSMVLSDSPTLRTLLLKYVQSLYVQCGYTALVNARSKLEERLARWLLMCADRVVGGKVPITHEFLGIMLGVRRPGVTVALQILEGRGLIQASRGQIKIRDRAGLVEIANGIYGGPEFEYERVLGKIHS